MNIKFCNGTVFNVADDLNMENIGIVNTVNCMGVMGAGIALEFKLRYPNMYNDYKIKCEKKLINTGKVDYYKDTRNIIVNFPTKGHFKYPSKLQFISEGLRHFISTYKEHNLDAVVFPKLGTLNGGLDWEVVKHEMEYYLSKIDIPVYICEDSIPYAEGIEKAMVDRYNALSVQELCEKGVKLNQVQKESLNRQKQQGDIQRFWQISLQEKIGPKTYANIFSHFYQNNDECKQITFFDIDSKVYHLPVPQVNPST